MDKVVCLSEVGQKLSGNQTALMEVLSDLLAGLLL